MAGLLANACSEEPDALIALVRVCGGAPRVTGGLYPETPRTAVAIAGVFWPSQHRRTQTLARPPSGTRLTGERCRACPEHSRTGLRSASELALRSTACLESRLG